MCPANSELPKEPAPVIPITNCMLCKKRRAQPETGICRPCERHAYSVSDLLGLAGIVAVLGLFTSACAAPCTYQGKAVPRAEVARMKDLGMDVRCPDGMEALGDQAARETDAEMADREKALGVKP